MLIYFRREYSSFNVMSGRGYIMAGATRLSPTEQNWLQSYMKCVE